MNTANSTALIQATLDDTLLDLDALCRLTAVPPQWVIERVEAGLLRTTQAGGQTHWRFDTVALHRVRQMHHYERHFDAVPELAALVSDLMEEIDRLRVQLAQKGLRNP